MTKEEMFEIFHKKFENYNADNLEGNKKFFTDLNNFIDQEITNDSQWYKAAKKIVNALSEFANQVHQLKSKVPSWQKGVNEGYIKDELIKSLRTFEMFSDQQLLRGEIKLERVKLQFVPIASSNRPCP